MKDAKLPPLRLREMGVWHGKDYNRRATFCFYYLFGRSVDGDGTAATFLVLKDLPGAPGMSVTNCVALIAGDFVVSGAPDKIRVFELSEFSETEAGGFDEFQTETSQWRRLPAADAAMFDRWRPLLQSERSA